MPEEKKSCTKKELREDFNCSRTTWIKWMRKLGIPITRDHIYTPKQLHIIYDKLGEP